MVKGLPAARPFDVIVHVVVGRSAKRFDACGRSRGVEERSPGLDELFHPGVERIVPVERVAGRLVNDVVKPEALWNDLPLGWNECDEVIEVYEKSIDIVDVLEVGHFDRGLDRFLQIRPRFEQAQQVRHDGFVVVPGGDPGDGGNKKKSQYRDAGRLRQALDSVT